LEALKVAFAIFHGVDVAKDSNSRHIRGDGVDCFIENIKDGTKVWCDLRVIKVDA
jgi:hypothetical protein